MGKIIKTGNVFIEAKKNLTGSSIQTIKYFEQNLGNWEVFKKKHRL